jgi:two-component system KDP operon response regulator KdpE
MLKNRTVLLIDAKPQIRGALRNALVSQGSNIIDVESRCLALEVLRARAVDLIVLDTNMPGTVGLDICRAIRTGWDVPIIIVALCDSDKDKVEALDGGADDFISRPFNTEELMARIRAALRRTGFATDRTTRAPVRLPCGHYLPEDQILGLATRIRFSHREPLGAAARPGAGRPKKIVICRKCGEAGGTLEMRSHKCSAETSPSMVSFATP